MSWAVAITIIMIIAVFCLIIIAIGAGMVNTFFMKMCIDVPIVCGEPFFVQGYKLIMWSFLLLILILLVSVIVEIMYLRARYSW